MNYTDLLLGIFLMIIGIGYLIYYIIDPSKYPKLKDGFTHVGQTKVSVGIFILFIIGLLMVISELQKIL